MQNLRKIGIILLLSFFFWSISSAKERERLDLSGNWNYRLKNAPSEIAAEGILNLPGTLDQQRKSIYNPPKSNTQQFRREYSFEGEAIFSKNIEIPKDWEDKEIFLFLERTKPTVVKVDGMQVGSNSKISSGQKYRLSDFLKPGNHLIEISVNNLDSIPPIVRNTSNATSESTQTNWNGILGGLYLEARDSIFIEKVEVIDPLEGQAPGFKIYFSETPELGSQLQIDFDGENISVPLTAGQQVQEIPVSGIDVELWSSQNPRLYNVKFSLKDKSGEINDEFNLQTGFRNFYAKENRFMLNGHPIFLRGTVNAAVFPKTGYAPTDLESWTDYFSILKEYGLNHVRFHSWTPPEAAFKAADKLGFYLLVEMPLWGEIDRDLEFQNRFLKEELKGIMDAYGHHPSLMLFSPGAELWGDLGLMGEFKDEAKKLNPRILSTYGSNVYLGMNGQIGDEDFIISSKTGGDDRFAVRGSMSFVESKEGGYFNSHSPNSEFTYKDAVADINVPLISHETGQYQSYPVISDLKGYDGVLKPDNLQEFQTRVSDQDVLRKNRSYTENTLQWAGELYKAENEAAMRTPGIAGTEMFGLQDYPGQGYAAVGLLDVFMHPKAEIDMNKWRQTFSDFTVLAEFPKFIFRPGENIDIRLLSANFSGQKQPLSQISWHTGFVQGEMAMPAGEGVNKIGDIKFVIPEVKVPKKETLVIKGKEGKVLNSYDFWIYPDVGADMADVVLTDNLEEAEMSLRQGKKVVLCPDSATVAATTVKGQFVPDFWNYGIYKKMSRELGSAESAGTLGLSIAAKHDAFNKFPTENHTDWQWYSIIKNSRPLIIDRLPSEFESIVEVIDNIERGYPLSLMFECKVGKGNLLVLMCDLQKLKESVEGKWLVRSILEYAGSKNFKPRFKLTEEQLEKLLKEPSVSRLVKEMNGE